MILAWTEVNTVVAVGLCSGIGFAAVSLWVKSNAAALAAEKGRLDLVVAEVKEAKRECEERDKKHEDEIKALQAEIRDLWTAHQEPGPPFPGPARSPGLAS